MIMNTSETPTHGAACDRVANTEFTNHPPRTHRLGTLTLVTLLMFVPWSSLTASVAVYVGKNLTEDGSVILAGYGDEPSSHWLEIVPRQKHAPGSTIRVGVTGEARLPGQLIDIPQVAETFKFITMNYSYWAGFPAPLTNGGMNEHQVAARDVALSSRPELVRMTPNPQRGPNYSDLSRIVMQRAKTAREAVEIVGRLIDEFGYSTYGGNSHVFADPNEGWVLLNFAGGQKLWIAKRLGPDDIWLNWRNENGIGYIQDIPSDLKTNSDYMASDNFISFAVDRGWYDPKRGEPFNVIKVYCSGNPRRAEAEAVQNELRKRAPRVTVKDVMRVIRASGRDSSGYGQVAHLKRRAHSELGVVWCAPASPLTAPFIPYRLGIRDVPPEFKRHRYLTAGEASREVIDPADVGLESTRFAFRSCKRLYYLATAHRRHFLPEVTQAMEAFEDSLIEQQETVERTALTLLEAGERELARRYLTYYCQTEAGSGLRLVEALTESLEVRAKLQSGIRAPAASK